MEVAALLVFLFFLWLGYDHFFRIAPKKHLSKNYQELLHQLGEDALHQGEVPVSALLLYKGKVIGKGGNKVFKTKRLSEHAEIVALNEAYARLGDEFFLLDRSQLVMYTSFEPCDMCKGALVEYNVKHICFEYPKPFSMQFKFKIKRLRIELLKRLFLGKGKQEELFESHPNYPKHRKK